MIAMLAFVRVRRVLLVAGLVFAALPVGSALAQSPAVFAGYSDGLRSARSSHPSPWEGDPGVVFEGCNYFTPSRCPGGGNTPTYDGGALMLVNNTNTGQTMTVTAASVTIGSCTYAPWPGLNVTVAPGGILILAQTGGPPPCPGVTGDYNFDTSEANHSRTPCVNNNEIPEIHITVDGQPRTYQDAGQILNTGGEDPAVCGAKDETEPWEEIAGGAVPSYVLAPTTGAHGSPAILSALRAVPRRLSLAGRSVGRRCVKPTRKNNQDARCVRQIALKLRYRLNVAAAVIFTVARQMSGRKVHGRCLAVTRKNRRRAGCARLIRLPGALRHASTAGSNTFTFHGRIGGKRLGPGTYRVTATPVANGSPGVAQTVTFVLTG